jgi:uncharacterized DUF497 family protein
MEIVFDPAKETSNIAKHGVSLADAANLIWDEGQVKIDDSQYYGEIREIGFAPIGDRLYCVVFTDRGDVRRIISLRKATEQEVKFYVEQA